MGGKPRLGSITTQAPDGGGRKDSTAKLRADVSSSSALPLTSAEHRQVREACLLWLEVLALGQQADDAWWGAKEPGRASHDDLASDRFGANVLDCIKKRNWLSELRRVVDHEKHVRRTESGDTADAPERQAALPATLDQDDRRRLDEICRLWDQVVTLYESRQTHLAGPDEHVSPRYCVTEKFDRELLACIKTRYWQRSLRQIVKHQVGFDVGTGVCIIRGALRRRANEPMSFDKRLFAEQLSLTLPALVIPPAKIEEALDVPADNARPSWRLAVELMALMSGCSVRTVGYMYRTIRSADRLAARAHRSALESGGAVSGRDDRDPDSLISDFSQRFGELLGIPGVLEIKRRIG